MIDCQEKMKSRRYQHKFMEKNLEFQAVPKSQLSSRRALLCFITSPSTMLRDNEAEIDAFSSFKKLLSSPESLCILYCCSASMNACLAAPYNGRRTLVEIPNLWSLLQKTESVGLAFDSLDPKVLSDDGLSASSRSASNWEG